MKEILDNEIEEVLQHFGTKGMRWGQRRPADAKTVKLGNGQKLTISTDHPPALARMLALINPKIKKEQSKSKILTLSDANGKKVGDMQLYKESINIVWVGVKTKNRGRGYGTAAVKAAIDYAKDSGLKKVTLEVPGNSPDAKHIYSKLGFKETGEILGDKNDVWEGLTKMELKIKG